jgi:tetratricopeptide (TPR) repeat protein
MFKFFKKDSGVGKGPAPTPEQDVAAAQAALAKGDLRQAAFHAGCALSHDPTRREWLHLLDQIAGAAPDPLALAPLEENNYFATVATRAYLLARLGRLTEALDLLFQAVMSKPDVPYLEWGIAWLEHPGAQGRVDSGSVERFLAEVVQNWPMLSAPDGPGRPTVERLPRLIHAVRKTGLRGNHLLFLSASVLRRTGAVADALQVAREAYQLYPGYEAAVAVAYALREQGDISGAFAAYEKALEHDPHDLAVRLDMADMLWDNSYLDGAERLYGEVLQREPHHPWALPSYYSLQYKRTGQEAWREHLEAYASANPDNDRARFLMRDFTPYFGGYLPDPTEATVNVARHVVEAVEKDPATAPTGIGRVAVSCLEAPSAVLAVRQQLQLLKFDGAFEFEVAQVASPDPRKPRCRVDYLLWRYQGTNAVPALPPPPQPVQAAVAWLASQPFNLKGWRDQGRQVAAQLGQVPVEAILAVMVHPSFPPQGMRSWTWIYRLQFAAALVLAGLDTGWKGSRRRAGLLSVANGPMDWSVDAALVALATIAWEDPEAEQEIAQLHVELLRNIPREGYVCYLEPLVLCALQRPRLDPAERQQWEGILQDLHSD